MKKVFDNKLLISVSGNISTTQGVYENAGVLILLNEDGTVNNEYDFLFNNQSEFNPNTYFINDLCVGQDSKIYLAGSPLNNNLALLAFTTESLVPHLSINGNSITAQINARNVAFQWSVNGTILPGETNSTLAISSIGQYVVTVFDTTACGSYSDTLNIQFVNINKITHHKTRVFPNPAVDLLSIQADEQIETLTLFDVTGREIFRKMNVPKSVEINISDLPCGIYFIKTNDDTSKFIKTD